MRFPLTPALSPNGGEGELSSAQDLLLVPTGSGHVRIAKSGPYQARSKIDDVRGQRVKVAFRMSDKAAAPTIVYLAQGRVRVKAADGVPRTLESAYGNSIREKEVRSQQRHSWKGAGNNGSPFSGRVLWGKAAMSQDVPLSVTSICGGKQPGGLIYSLESGSLCALLEAEGLGAEERRVWNDNRTRIRHVTVSRPAGDLAFAVLHENGTANIGLKMNGESGVKEITEGDSFDTAPHWLPGEEKRIVFQSAGIGRNREGQFQALGQFSIQQLDVETGEMTTLLEDKRYDYLAARFCADGGMLYIQRPYAEGKDASVEPVEGYSAVSVPVDVCLFSIFLISFPRFSRANN